MRHALGSRKRGGAGLVALALALLMVFAACGGSSSKSPAKGTSGSTGSAGNTDWTNQVGGNGPIPGVQVETTKPVPGGSMNFAVDAATTGGYCLPEATLAIAGIQVVRSMYDYLAVPNDKGDYVPFLADKITPNNDYTKWTIHLRSGIKFSDGSALDAKVVKDNIDAYRGTFPARKPQLFIFVFDDIADTKVVDNMTVEVDMKSPWAAFPSSLYSYGRMGIMGEKQLNDAKGCFKDLVGTGPFMLQSWGGGNEPVVVVKNPNYWRKDSFGQQLPYLDKITFSPVPDGSQMLNGYKSKVRNLQPIITERGINRTPPQDMYFKGALFLNTLRSVVNDDQRWFALLHDLFQHFKYRNILTEEMVAFFNQRTGMNLTPVFDEYLRHAALPVLELKFNDTEGTVAYRWEADEPAFAMPVRVGANGNWQVIQPATEWKTMKTSIPKNDFAVATDL